MTTIERLARVLQDTPPAGGPPGFYTVDYRAQVRAILTELRDPDIDQIRAMYAASEREFDINAWMTKIWNAGLDTILAEQPAEAYGGEVMEGDSGLGGGLNVIRPSTPRFCGFCGKSPDEVFCLVEGPVTFICDECVELAADVVATKRAQEPTEADLGAGGGFR